MKSGQDYGWIVFLVIGVLIVILWKPMAGLFGKVGDKVSNKEGYDRGAAVFADGKRWIEGKNRSCAMCHDPAFKFAPGETTDMPDYHEGQITPLKGMRAKYYTSIGSDDDMLAAINKCMSMQTRIGTGTFSLQAQWMQDLLEYVKRQ